MQQAWKQDRLDLAEAMLKHVLPGHDNAASGPPGLGTDPAEVQADLFFEIGRDMFRKESYEMAVTWLERSMSVLLGADAEASKPDVGELRLSVVHYLGDFMASCGIEVKAD